MRKYTITSAFLGSKSLSSAILVSIFLLVSGFVQAQILPNLGGQRAGISAMTFLKNDLSPRSAAMGGASMALKGDAYTMGINPAGGVNSEYLQVAVAERFITAGLAQSYIGAIIPTQNRAAWMVSMNYLSTGNQQRRTEFQPFGDGTYYNSDAFKLGVGYSKALSKMFSFGVNANFIREQLAQYAVNAASIDLGFLYQTDWKDLSFAVGLQHFGVNSTLSGSELPVTYNRPNGVQNESYGAPTLFAMGISMIPLKTEKHQIITSLQLNHPNDNSENLRIGAEYCFDSLLFVRAGYKLNVIGENFSYGVGIKARLGAIPLVIEATHLPTSYLGQQFLLGLSIGYRKPGR